MFAPKVAKPPKKAAAAPAKGPARQGSSLTTRRLDTTQETNSASMSARETTLAPSWDFSKIPLLPPDPANPPQTSPPLKAPPPGIIPPKLAIGEVDDPLEHEADRVANQLAPSPSRSVPVAHASGTIAPPIVERAVAGPGRPLDSGTRTFFESRFGRSFSDVRVHDDPTGAAAAQAIGANAFTIGSHIGFAAGRYAPGTGLGARLMAHELTHVAQSSVADAPNVVRRDIAEADLAHTPVAKIMADPTYFENGIARIEFYGAEMARLIYSDGTQFDLGLVPGQIHAPVEAVDYRTPRSTHAIVGQQDASAGTIDFVPRARDIRAGPGVTFAQVIAATHRVIRFTHHTPTGRIMPTEVNSISAPRLCEALRGAEAEYARSTDALAHGMVRALTILNYALMIYSAIDAVVGIAGRAASASEAAAAATAASASRAQVSLTSMFLRLLRTGAVESTTVEGVGLGGVRATMRATELIVERDAIVNAGRVAGQGRLVNSAFEQAALAAAKQAGALTARVAYHTVVNAEWGAYLESMGYSYEVMAGTTPGVVATRVLTKVFTL